MYNKYYVSLGLQNEIEFESILFIKRKETIKKNVLISFIELFWFCGFEFWSDGCPVVSYLKKKKWNAKSAVVIISH